MSPFFHRIRVRDDGNCCTSCFAHPWPKELIRSESTESGQCDYCGSRGRRLLPIRRLADAFENLTGMYGDSADGVSLIDAVQDEWLVFSDKLHGSGQSRQLLEDILNSNWDDDGEPPVEAWDLVRKRAVLEDMETWEQFCFDVREDPNAEPAFGEVFEEDLRNVAEMFPAGSVLARARPGWASGPGGHREPFRGAEIGAPPPDRAGPARANRTGRAVLYSAEEERTAIAEVRPARGYWVTTCRIRLRREARILDLIDGIPIPNPFTNESLAGMRSLQTCWVHLRKCCPRRWLVATISQTIYRHKSYANTSKG